MRSKRAKHIMIWVSGLVVIVLLANVAATLFTKYFIEKQLVDMTCYVKRADTLLFMGDVTGNNESSNNISPRLKLRTLLDDGYVDVDQGIKGLFVCANPKIDTSVKFSSKSGESDLCEGVWSLVYRENADITQDEENNIGLLSVNDLCRLACARPIYELLLDNPDARLQLHSYAIKGVVIVPLTITVIGSDGSNLGMFNCQTVPEGYEKVDTEDTYIYNEHSDNPFDVADTLLSSEMGTAFQGERAVDIVAREKLEQVNNGKGIDEKGEYSWGFGGFTVIHAGVDGNYSMVVVREYNYMDSVVLYIVLLSILWTLVYVEVFVRKRGQSH